MIEGMPLIDDLRRYAAFGDAVGGGGQPDAWRFSATLQP
jgi:hypothetical protein